LKIFDDHLNHLDQVFKSAAKTGIMLATTKCHFAYQKVFHLGLSTHIKKGLAILKLEEPKNTHDLPIFFSMMVYFSAYIPFHAWIATSLFSLLKNNK
jgi:hypothetical protein